MPDESRVILWSGQIGKASRFEREKYRFEPCLHNLYGCSSMVERRSPKPNVAGSSPVTYAK